MTISWDWPHSNDVDFAVSTEIRYSPAKLGHRIAYKDEKADGVCVSKCAFWIKRCLDNGGPPLRRRDFDGGTGGVGVSPTSIAIQAVHVRNARDALAGKLTGSDNADQQVRGIVEKYGLKANLVGHDTTSDHGAWLKLAWGSKGGFEVMLSGANYAHALALWSDALFHAFFDPEEGQFARMNVTEFKSSVRQYFDDEYAGLEEWWVYQITA